MTDDEAWTDGQYGPRQQRGNDIILADAAYLNSLESELEQEKAARRAAEAIANDAIEFLDLALVGDLTSASERLSLASVVSHLRSRRAALAAAASEETPRCFCGCKESMHVGTFCLIHGECDNSTREGTDEGS